jgi:hypothetical protein
MEALWKRCHSFNPGHPHHRAMGNRMQIGAILLRPDAALVTRAQMSSEILVTRDGHRLPTGPLI